MVLFYENSDYAPYAVDGWGLSLTTSVSEPVRRQNRIIIEVDDCLTERTACQGSERATIYFNFTGANQMGAARPSSACLQLGSAPVIGTWDSKVRKTSPSLRGKTSNSFKLGVE